MDFRILLFEILIFDSFQVVMKCKRCHYMAVSHCSRLHDSSFGVRSFTKSELASQSNVRSCANLSSYKPIHGTFCVVLRSHFLLCKAINPEGQIVRMTTFSCIPRSRETMPCAGRVAQYSRLQDSSGTINNSPSGPAE